MIIGSVALTIRIIFWLGILNALTGALLLFSCRCVPTMSIFKGLMLHPWYKTFFKYHCYLWWVFWSSVIIHAALALRVYGINF
ncbi:MAG: hypothetical protein TUN42_05775 [Dehalogenimonas sp.]